MRAKTKSPAAHRHAQKQYTHLRRLPLLPLQRPPQGGLLLAEEPGRGLLLFLSTSGGRGGGRGRGRRLETHGTRQEHILAKLRCHIPQRETKRGRETLPGDAAGGGTGAPRREGERAGSGRVSSVNTGGIIPDSGDPIKMDVPPSTHVFLCQHVLFRMTRPFRVHMWSFRCFRCTVEVTVRYIHFQSLPFAQSGPGGSTYNGAGAGRTGGAAPGGRGASAAAAGRVVSSRPEEIAGTELPSA